MARLFFALWPDAASREKLAALAREVALVAGGRPVPGERIHLTLAFLGEIGGDRQAEVMRAGEEARGVPFRLDLDRVGSFRRARVAWAGCSRPPAPLTGLQAVLAASLASRGFALEERGFAAHLTLARKIAKTLPPGSIPAIGLEATALALVRSEAGAGRYTTLESWPLRGK